MENGDNEIVAFVVVLLFIVVIFAVAGGCWYAYAPESFAMPEELPMDANLTGYNTSGYNPMTGYNPLYTSPDLRDPGSFLYTQPPGDTSAQAYGGSGQGTSGEFLPLQGKGAGTFMKNSARSNLAAPSPDPGTIGGGRNYTTQTYSPSWIGFNNFGTPSAPTNSYLLSGANERVCNSGQKCDALRAQDWWPRVQKGPKGFTTQGSDAMVPCHSRTVNDCFGEGGRRFLKDKMGARWKKVVT